MMVPQKQIFFKVCTYCLLIFFYFLFFFVEVLLFFLFSVLSFAIYKRHGRTCSLVCILDKNKNNDCFEKSQTVRIIRKENFGTWLAKTHQCERKLNFTFALMFLGFLILTSDGLRDTTIIKCTQRVLFQVNGIIHNTYTAPVCLYTSTNMVYIP